ncbi:hypothetical protein OQA88_13048 [Cercophora sp. LCS_1]
MSEQGTKSPAPPACSEDDPNTEKPNTSFAGRLVQRLRRLLCKQEKAQRKEKADEKKEKVEKKEEEQKAVVKQEEEEEEEEEEQTLQQCELCGMVFYYPIRSNPQRPTFMASCIPTHPGNKRNFDDILKEKGDGIRNQELDILTKLEGKIVWDLLPEGSEESGQPGYWLCEYFSEAYAEEESVDASVVELQRYLSAPHHQPMD